MTSCKKIVVLGGGFAGVNCASVLQKLFKHKCDYEIVLINRHDYIVYQPLLTETVEGSISHSDMAASLRMLLPGVTFYFREITEVDLEKKQITLAPSFSHTPITLDYEHLVFALGNVTDFRQFEKTGLKEHAFHFKDLQDSIRLREQIIHTVEAAHTTIDIHEKRKLLTFIVGGGGFSGVEIAASILDLLGDLCRLYQFGCHEARVILVHSRERLMDREVSASLSHYAERLLKERGVEILFNTHLIKATPYQAFLDDGQVIPTRTIVLTAPSSPNPLIEKIKGLPLEKGKICTLNTLQIEGFPNLWAAGDCAKIANLCEQDTLAPPTAQFAVREGRLIGENIFRFESQQKLRPFCFKRLGMMASLGRHNAIAELFGTIKISGFLGWLMWRAVYLMKLPGIGRKIKVASSWILNLFVKDEPICLEIGKKQGILRLHYEPGETIFHQSDIGDFIYVIVHGSVQVIRIEDDKEIHLADLSDGEMFGELAVLDKRKRMATVRAKTTCEIIAVPKDQIEQLYIGFPEIRTKFEKLKQERLEAIAILQKRTDKEG